LRQDIGRLDSILGQSWTSANEPINGEILNGELNISHTSDLFPLVDAVQAGGMTVEEFYRNDDIRRNMVVVRAFMQSIYDSRHWLPGRDTYMPDLVEAMQLYDHLLGFTRNGIPVEHPGRHYEVAIMIEPLAAVNLHSSPGPVREGSPHMLSNVAYHTPRTLELIMMGRYGVNGDYNFSNNRTQVMPLIQLNAPWPNSWFGPSTLQRAVLGLNTQGLVSESGSADRRIFYTGPISRNPDVHANIDNGMFGFGMIYAPIVDKAPRKPTLTLVKVHEFGSYDATGQFIPNDALTYHEITPILSPKDFGNIPAGPRSEQWFNPENERYINHTVGGANGNAQLISRHDILSGATPAERRLNGDEILEVADFGRHELREWWSTTETRRHSGFHSSRGTAHDEVYLVGAGGEDLGTRETYHPAPEPGVNLWHWMLV